MKLITKRKLNALFIFSLTIISLMLILKSGNAQSKLTVFISSIFIYLIWAYIYHLKDKSLTLATFLEYVLTAVLAIILLMGILTV